MKTRTEPAHRRTRDLPPRLRARLPLRRGVVHRRPPPSGLTAEALNELNGFPCPIRTIPILPPAALTEGLSGAWRSAQWILRRKVLPSEVPPAGKNSNRGGCVPEAAGALRKRKPSPTCGLGGIYERIMRASAWHAAIPVSALRLSAGGGAYALLVPARKPRPGAWRCGCELPLVRAWKQTTSVCWLAVPAESTAK